MILDETSLGEERTSTCNDDDETNIQADENELPTVQENYTLADMSDEVRMRNTMHEPDAARHGKEITANQPKDFHYPKKKFGKEERGFLPSWYDKWTWLDYDEIKDCVFCIFCKNANHHGMLNDVKIEASFITSGFNHWKHATSTNKGFHKHESSKCHQQAYKRLIEIPRSSKDVSHMINQGLCETQNQNRSALVKIISALRYLARQGLPLRGHGNDIDSNFKQLLKYRAEDDPAFANWLKKKENFTSPDIQNELLKDMSLAILRDIIKEIKSSDFHSIMLDETSDVWNKEQAVFCVRWVDKNLWSHEDFLGLHELVETDATTLANVIKDILVRLGFDSGKLRGQCYDGCSTMMGKKKGVAVQIKNDVQSRAICIHCFSHSLNLACGDWIRNSTVVSKSLDTSYEITKLVKFSPKRDSHLRKIHEEEYFANEETCSSKCTTLRLFSETRWTVRASSLMSIYENYEELEELWHWCLLEYKDREAKARVNGVQAQMRTFEYFFGLRLGILLLRHSDNLSASLQAKDMCAAEGQKMALTAVATLKKNENR